jgi:hypothetical protein
MLRDDGDVAREVFPQIKDYAWRCFCTNVEAPENIKEKVEDLEFMDELKPFSKWEEYMSTERMALDIDEFQKEGWVDNIDEEGSAKFVCKYVLTKVSKAFKNELDKWKKEA